MAALQPPETTEAQKQKEKDKEELILPDYKDKIKNTEMKKILVAFVTLSCFALTGYAHCI